MDEGNFTSKTQRKTAMLNLQTLGEELLSLPEDRLAKLDLPENLLRAVIEAKRIHKHGALKRQRQYIGRLMRDVDATPIRKTLDGWRRQSGAAVAAQHLAERWRDRLIGDDAAFTIFAEQFSAADLPRLRQLVRNAREEQSQGKPPRAYRECYRALHEIIVGKSLMAGEDPALPPSESLEALIDKEDSRSSE